ncbi:MAG: potassium-transporting ATPase subunit KdpA, partial [Nitrososphaerales archaeon]
MLSPLQVLDLIIILGVALVSAWLLSPYVTSIFKNTPSKIDRFLSPIENLIYRVTGVDPNSTMGWKEYFLSALFLNLVQMAIAFFILTFQGSLPLNPQHYSGFTWDLALNTVVSFATNTNLQH